MKKTKLVIKSTIDGILHYILFYLWTSFIIWLGINMMKIYPVTFAQVFGAFIVSRQIIALFRVPTDNHVKQPLNLKKDESCTQS